MRAFPDRNPRILATALSLVLVVAACNTDEMTPEDDAQLIDVTDQIVGTWQLDSFTVDDVVTQVQIGVNAAVQPALTFDEFVSGEAGCNSLSQGAMNGYEVVGSKLKFDQIVIDASECVPPTLMDVELALVEHALWSGDEIALIVSEQKMTWLVDEATFVFTRR